MGKRWSRQRGGNDWDKAERDKAINIRLKKHLMSSISFCRNKKQRPLKDFKNMDFKNTYSHKIYGLKQISNMGFKNRIIC